MEEIVKKNKFLIGLVVVLGVSILTQGFTQNPLAASNPEKVKGVASDFIANNLLNPEMRENFEVKDVTKKNGLYEIKLEVGGQEYTSYMTTDQSMFFTSGVSMKDTEEGGNQTAQEPQEIPQSENPTVQLFTMSFCPYGNQAEDLIMPVVDLLGDAVEIEPHYIFYDNYQGGGPEYCIDEESKYCAMHGVNEANQHVRELCVYENQKDKYWTYIDQVNQDCSTEDVETCWKTAAQAVGVNSTTIESCFNNKKLALAEDEVKLTDENGVTGSPALVINGVKYSGERSAEGYKGAICGAFTEAPEACETELEGAEGASAVEGSCN